jgi:protein-S-isoprenylcysteine O-methyltransferase Ste14
MTLLKIYLIAGLIFHKLLWEVLKRKPHQSSSLATRKPTVFVLAVKAVKIGILLGIAAQTMLADLLPITDDAGALRIIGFAVFTTGLLMAIVSRIQLGKNWSDIETARVGAEQAVVAKGLYRFIRHPIYVGDLLLLVGLELSLNSWLVILAVLIAPIVLRQAIIEERSLVTSLPGYGAYCMRTKRFIPFVV